MSQNILSLQGKVALISGASTGLGEHFARTFAEAGAVVVVAARRGDRIQAVAEAIRKNGGRALATAMDVTDRASVKTAFDTAQQYFGIVDVVVCNAGLGGGTPFLQMSEQGWDSMIAVNLKGVWNVGQEAALRLVAANRPGSIINISSILGLQAFPAFAHYCASKSAVIQLSRVMALELAPHHIRVNAVAPGYFETDMTRDYYQTEAGKADVEKLPLRRLGEFHELDGQMLLLASDAGSYMTGGTYTVDGAHSARLG